MKKHRLPFEGPSLFEFAGQVADQVTTAARNVRYAIANITMKARNGIFEPWIPLLRFAGARPHGVPLIESSALAVIKAPVPNYEPVLPAALIESGALSEAQLEAITLIGEAHAGKVRLRDPANWKQISRRRGFKLGAGMGTGKSRILLGAFIDNFLQCRKKAIFITETANLVDALRRDYESLGRDPEEIVEMREWRIDQPIELRSGILFATYAMMRSNRDIHGVRYRRVNQIVDWLSDCSDGLLIFDESQNLGNAVRGARGTDQHQNGSKQGVAALELQERLPDVRVIYSSATSDDHIDSLAYAPRLGLWGIDTPFYNRATFLNSMRASGVAAMEVVCQHLKSQGLYWAPQLSAEGITTEILIHPLSRAEVAMINTFNMIWRQVESGLNRALVATHAAHATAGNGRMVRPITGSSAAHARLSYMGAQQRFYALAYMSLRMPTVITHMRERLAAGEACVLQTHNTYESSQKAALAQFDPSKDSLDNLDISPRGVLIEWLEENFPTAQHRRYFEGEVERADIIRDPKTGAIVRNEEAMLLRDNLVERIQSLILPENPLDILVNEFGPEQVAEITGRSQRLVYRQSNGRRQRVIEHRGKKAVDADLAAFMDDDKQILVFSESKGGIGQSYHADLSRKNQRKRNHYLLQVSWRAIDALQGLGRTHRTNQACPPHYILTTTSVPAETRFISTIAKRLGELGALTRGNRDADGSILIDQSMSIENEYAEHALDQMIAEIGADLDPKINAVQFAEQIGIDPVPYAAAWSQGSGGRRNAARLGSLPRIDIKRFLNRLMAVDVDINGGFQGEILSGLVNRMNERRNAAIVQGTYDPGLRTITGLSINVIDERIIYENASKGQYLKVVTLERTEAPTATTFETARLSLSYLKAMHPSDRDGGWFMRRDGIPEIRLPIYVGKSTAGLRILSPHSSRYLSDLDDVAKSTHATTEDAAKAAWDNAFSKSRPVQTEQLHLVVGTLLPFWQSFYGATTAKRNSSKDEPHRPTIWKAVTDDGRPVIGIRFTQYDSAQQLVDTLNERIQRHLEWERKSQEVAEQAAAQRSVAMIA